MSKKRAEEERHFILVLQILYRLLCGYWEEEDVVVSRLLLLCYIFLGLLSSCASLPSSVILSTYYSCTLYTAQNGMERNETQDPRKYNSSYKRDMFMSMGSGSRKFIINVEEMKL